MIDNRAGLFITTQSMPSEEKDRVKRWPWPSLKHNLLYSTNLTPAVSLFGEGNNGLLGVSSVYRLNRLTFAYTHFKSCDRSLDKTSFDFSNSVSCHAKLCRP